MEAKKSNRGGARAGAGRKSVDGRATVGSITVSVDQDSFDLIHDMGNGNLSLGVRTLAHAYMNRESLTIESKPVKPQRAHAMPLPVQNVTPRAPRLATPTKEVEHAEVKPPRRVLYTDL